MSKTGLAENLHITIASTSFERFLWFIATVARIGVLPQVLLQAVAPPVEEPDNLEAVDIALFYKVLPTAVLLRLLGATDSLVKDLPWVNDSVESSLPSELFPDSQARGESIVFGSDVRTFVLAVTPKELERLQLVELEALLVMPENEVFKLDRQTGGLPEGFAAQVIALDKVEYEQRYFSHRAVTVKFCVGLASWSTSSGEKTEKYELMAKFKPGAITRKMLDRAYAPDGSARYSGARLDLAKLIAEGKAAQVYVKTEQGWQELEHAVTAEIVLGLVRGGVADFETMVRVLGLGEEAVVAASGLQQPQEGVEPVRSYLHEQFFNHITIEQIAVGDSKKTYLVLPEYAAGLPADPSNSPVGANGIRIEITELSDASYRIEPDGVLLLAHQLGRLGVERTSIVQNVKELFASMHIVVD